MTRCACAPATRFSSTAQSPLPLTSLSEVPVSRSLSEAMCKGIRQDPASRHPTTRQSCWRAVRYGKPHPAADIQASMCQCCSKSGRGVAPLAAVSPYLRRGGRRLAGSTRQPSRGMHRAATRAPEHSSVCHHATVESVRHAHHRTTTNNTMAHPPFVTVSHPDRRRHTSPRLRRSSRSQAHALPAPCARAAHTSGEPLHALYNEMCASTENLTRLVVAARNFV